MPNTEHPVPINKRVLHRVVYLMLGSITLIVTINSYDSGIAKAPLLALFASLLVVAFLAQSIWMRKLLLRRSSADIPVLLLLLLVTASTFTTKYAWNSQQALAVWVPFIICFFAGTQLFATQEEVDKFVWALAMIGSIVCIVGLIQFFFAEELFLDFFMGKERRVTSTLTNAVYLSGYIVLVFPTLLAFTVSKRRKSWERRVLIILLCCLVFLLIATSTRSSIAAFIVSVIVFGLVSRRLRKKALIWTVSGVIAAGAAALYLSPSLVERVERSFRSDAGSTISRRWYFWDAGYNAFKAAPFFGHGIGSFESVMLEYRSPEYWMVKSEDVVPHAHNELIETAVDLGGVGVIAYLLILGTIFLTGSKAGVQETENVRLLRAGLMCSLLAIIVDNITNMSLRVVPVGATAWMIMGILAAQPFRHLREVEVPFRFPKAIAILLPAMWILFAVRYGNQQLSLLRADTHIIKGVFAGMAKNFTTAVNEYQLAIAQNPHTLVARSNLALALLMAGRTDEALQTATRLQMFSPQYPKSNLIQAAALISLHRYPEALRMVDAELMLRTHPDAYFYQALAYNGLADTMGELSALEHVLLASIKGRIPYQLEPVSLRVRTLAQKEEDHKRLKQLYEQLYSLFPGDRSVTTTLAEFCVRIGETERASQLRQLPPEPVRK